MVVVSQTGEIFQGQISLDGGEVKILKQEKYERV